MADYPSGTVTFLFTDIEGSTKRWTQGPGTMRAAVQRHLDLLDAAIAAHEGIHFKTVGDAVQAAFPTARDGLAAAVDAQQALAVEPWSDATGPLRVRMALHAGSAVPQAHDYLAPCLNRLARLLATGYGGQILLTDTLRRLLDGWLPDGAGLRDLGRHRLRDLLEPEDVWQVAIAGLLDAFPPLKSLEGHPTNLPMQPNPLLGREPELATLGALLVDPAVHLITLTGPGGVGKTRLALHAAADALDAFPDGTFLVDCAPLTEPTLVIPTVAAALGVHEHAGESVRDSLIAWLKSRRVLLVLDNLEHLLPVAPEIATLLAACPALTLLATAREPLRIRAEHSLPVAPLPLPDTDEASSDLAASPAVALFVERAQALDPRFVLTDANANAIAAICRRLDGLPLAIELAAARIRMLPPKALLTRLDRRLPVLTGGARDAPARQRTLRDTIAWSYDLLETDEQALFRRLAVFAGGWTFEAAEAVVGHDHEVDLFAGLGALVDKSLVRQAGSSDAEPRFGLLETIREFALERLVDADEAEHVRNLHAAYFTGHVAAAQRRWTESQQSDCLDAIEAEIDNHRAALSWWLDGHHDPIRGAQLAADSGWFWWIRDIHASEGRGWLTKALAVSDLPDRVRSLLLKEADALADIQADYDAVADLSTQALALAQRTGSRADEARARSSLGWLSLMQADFDTAAQHFDAALAIARDLGEPIGIAAGLIDLGNVAVAQGRTADARAQFSDALAILHERGDRRGAAGALHNLAFAMLRDGDLSGAISRFEEALAHWREIGDGRMTGMTLDSLGEAARHMGDLARAQSLHEEASTIFEAIGFARGLGLCAMNIAWVALARGEVDKAITGFQDALRRFQTLGDREYMPGCLEGLAAALTAVGRPGFAARLLGAAAALRKQIGMPVPRSEQANYDRLVGDVRDVLRHEAFEEAWQAGARLGFDDAVRGALARE